MKWGRVLIVDDETQIRRVLSKILEKFDCEVHSVATGEEALELIEKEPFDFMLVDLALPGLGGLEILKEAKRNNPEVVVVVTTTYGSIEPALQALKIGANNFLQKPFDAEQLRELVEQALSRKRGINLLESPVGPEEPGLELVGSSKIIKELRNMVERIAQVKSTVLLCGEPGSGKELIARFIHKSSDRGKGPFVAVNCATLQTSLAESSILGDDQFLPQGEMTRKPGYFEEADKGTLYFEEINLLDLSLQGKILRVLQECEVTRVGSSTPIPVDARVIASTSVNLREMVEEKKFHQDLFYRLSVLSLTVPPLRDHKEDIPQLINHILGELRRANDYSVKGATPEYLAVLNSYDFPGNVRELENLIEHSVLLTSGTVLSPETLPPEVIEKAEISELSFRSEKEGLTLKQAKALATERMESRLIKRTLDESKGNFSLAARKLRISRSALYYKIKRYKIPPPN